MTMPPAAAASAITIGSLLRWARRALQQAGVEHADQEAVWLIAHALGVNTHHLAADSSRALTSGERRTAESLVTRRAAREPLQYVLGTQEFCGLEFDVTPAVLIPRPETELLVQKVVRHAGRSGVRVVDVGTGSGCIAVALAAALSDAAITAIDRSSAALAVAKSNAAKHGVAHRIEWVEGDWLDPLRAEGGLSTWDVIVSNPPYIAEHEWGGLQPEVRLFEPRLALVGGADGTECHARLLRDARPCLKEGGLLIMEIGQGQAPALRGIAERTGGYAPLRVVPDEAGIERVVIAERAG